MNFTLIGVIILCAGLGYALMNFFLSGPSRPRSEDDPLGIGARRQHAPPPPPPRQPPADIPEPWYDILGVAPDATLEQIKRGYRQKISQYHPDKVANSADEIRQLAESRSKQINTAYEYAISRPGMSPN
jgi:DnaJ-domain-containing protein 1